MTSYHAVLATGQVKAGATVGIIGFAGLGHLCSRVAVLADADVYVAETNERVWQNALDGGVKDIRKSIKAFQGVDFDVIIDFAGFGTTTAEAIDTVRVGGRVVQVGRGCLEATTSTGSSILRQVTLVGSLGGTREDIEGVYRYFASSELTPTLTQIGFEEIPESLARLKRGEVTGSLVAQVAG